MIGKIFPTNKDLMNHLANFGTLTDDEIELRCTNKYGIDAQQMIELILERDICKTAIDNIKNFYLCI